MIECKELITIKKFLIVLTTIFILFTTKVNASSINYNLNISKDLEFTENIYYTVDNKDIDKKHYNILTSVVYDPIYFDINKSVKYTKSIQKTNTGYLVALKHRHSSIFINNERIIKECFSRIIYNSTADSLSFESEGTFYCSHRANRITINITTPLTVTSNNADIVKSNTYTWNKIDKDFDLSFNLQKPKIEETPMDSLNDSDANDNNENSNKEESNNKEDSIGDYIVIGLGIMILISLPIIAIILKKKKDALDRI